MAISADEQPGLYHESENNLDPGLNNAGMTCGLNNAGMTCGLNNAGMTCGLNNAGMPRPRQRRGDGGLRTAGVFQE